MQARMYLEQIERYDKFIQEKLAEIYQLRCMATSVTAAMGTERVQSSSASDKLGNIVAAIADKEEEVQQMINHFFAEKAERIQLIEKLDNLLEYTVLHDRYIQYMALTDVAEKEGYSYQYILEIHGRALKNIQIFLNNLYKPMETYI